MLRKVWEWLRGRVLVQVSGRRPERFLNLCAGGGLALRQVKATAEDGKVVLYTM